MRAAPRVVRAAVGLGVLGALGVGLYALGQHLVLFVRRASFPLDLEWMEGGMLLHAQRLLDGQPIYAPPSIDFIPYLYTPLYPALLAALATVAPLGYLLGRVVSITAFVGALALLVVAAARQGGPAFAGPGWSPGRDRWLSVPTGIGLAGAGVVAASFTFTGSFYDLVRADSLLLVLQAAALTAAVFGAGLGSAAAAGALIALAFFTKQTASVMGLAMGLGLLAAGWRRGVVYGLTAAGVLGAGLLLLNLGSGGWFWRYVFELHQSHGFNARLAYVETPLRLLRQFGPLYAGLGVAVAALALRRQLHRRDAVHLLAALAGFAAACIGFGTQWAFDNAFIPAVYFPAFSVTLLGARLIAQARSEAIASALPAAVASVLIATTLTLQTLPEAAPNRRFLPTPADRQAAGRFLEHLRGLPGPLFVPFHPWYAVLAGSPPHVHRMGVLDVAARYGRPAGLDEALAGGRYGHVVLDWKSQPWEWPTLEARYHEIHRFTDGVDAVRSFSGAETSPRRLLARTTAAPPPPPEARTLQDFEGGWRDWAPRGDAFGSEPAPAQAGLYGRAAADSRRLGPTAEGELRSPPLRLDRPRLRFRLVGPADPGLRVLLLDGPEAVRSASPTGKPADIEWDVAPFKVTSSGRPLTLIIEDRSATGGLAVDEILSY